MSIPKRLKTEGRWRRRMVRTTATWRDTRRGPAGRRDRCGTAPATAGMTPFRPPVPAVASIACATSRAAALRRAALWPEAPPGPWIPYEPPAWAIREVSACP